MALTSASRPRTSRPVGRTTGTVMMCVALAWGSGTARATGAEAQAQLLFNQGVEAARESRWSDARAAFERAYGLSPRPVVLINLAGAEARTGQLMRAARNYRRILEGTPSPDNAAFRKAAREVLPTLEARIPRIRLYASGLGPTDVVEIDGDTVAPGQVADPHLVDPGPHTVVVKRLGVERARVAFSLAEGESHYMSVPAEIDPPKLKASPALATSTPGVDLRAEGPVAAAAGHSRRSWWTSPWLWTAVAATSAATITAAVLSLRNQDQIFSGNLPPGHINIR
jgi:hypothetical protein